MNYGLNKIAEVNNSECNLIPPGCVCKCRCSDEEY